MGALRQHCMKHRNLLWGGIHADLMSQFLRVLRLLSEVLSSRATEERNRATWCRSRLHPSNHLAGAEL